MLSSRFPVPGASGLRRGRHPGTPRTGPGGAGRPDGPHRRQEPSADVERQNRRERLVEVTPAGTEEKAAPDQNQSSPIVFGGGCS